MRHSPTPWMVKEALDDAPRWKAFNEIVDANGVSITDDTRYYPSAPGLNDMHFIVGGPAPGWSEIETPGSNTFSLEDVLHSPPAAQAARGFFTPIATDSTLRYHRAASRTLDGIQ